MIGSVEVVKNAWIAEDVTALAQRSFNDAVLYWVEMLARTLVILGAVGGDRKIGHVVKPSSRVGTAS